MVVLDLCLDDDRSDCGGHRHHHRCSGSGGPGNWSWTVHVFVCQKLAKLIRSLQSANRLKLYVLHSSSTLSV